MDLNKLHKDSESLRIYELFENPYKKYGDFQAYFAIHTLNRLYLELDKSKDSKEIREIVKPYLSEFTVHPYLMLEGLTDGKESEIVKLIFNDINTNLFPNKNLDKDVIKRIEYPSLDVHFMKNLLNTICREKKDEKFQESSKAKELFLHYAEKQHIEMTLKELESYANSYHKSNDDGGGLDNSDD
jgi:hypothetical protein